MHLVSPGHLSVLMFLFKIFRRFYFTYMLRPYGNSRSAGRITGKMRRIYKAARVRKKFAYGRTDRKLGLSRSPAGRSFTLRRIWGEFSVSRSRGSGILGKSGKNLLTKNSQKIFLNGLTLRKFGACRPWSRR